MSTNRRHEPELQPLGRCFWCDQMCFPGAMQITGAADRILLHRDCGARLQQECATYGERAPTEDSLPSGYSTRL